MRFAVFILSHGRAKTICTYRALRRCGYTGDLYVVIDNEDSDEVEYRRKFGDDIIQFDKRDYVAKTDLGDTDNDRRIGVFARNFIQDKAKEMGYQYHLQLDDDIHGFAVRKVIDGKLATTPIRNMDRVLEAMCQFMDDTPTTALSFGLAMYYVGGPASRQWKQQMLHKTMTTFLMRADHIEYFHMRMNDDITTSALNVSRGMIYYTYMPLMVEVDGTQEQKGGMTDIYVDNGTYRKSFYTVMALPSCSYVATMGLSYERIHHEVRWANCAPKVLSEGYRHID